MQGKKRFATLLSGSLLLLLLSFYLSLRFGSTHLDTTAFFGGLLCRTGKEQSTLILYAIRLPRALGAVFAGEYKCQLTLGESFHTAVNGTGIEAGKADQLLPGKFPVGK